MTRDRLYTVVTIAFAVIGAVGFVVIFTAQNYGAFLTLLGLR
jgi:preprotein translocase subunit Sss1